MRVSSSDSHFASDLVYVEGQLRYNDFTDREGIQRTKAEITQSKQAEN